MLRPDFVCFSVFLLFFSKPFMYVICLYQIGGQMESPTANLWALLRLITMLSRPISSHSLGREAARELNDRPAVPLTAEWRGGSEPHKWQIVRLICTVYINAAQGSSLWGPIIWRRLFTKKPKSIHKYFTTSVAGDDGYEMQLTGNCSQRAIGV